MDRQHREYMEARCRSLIRSARQYLTRFHTAIRRKDKLIAASYLRLLNEKMAHVRAFAIMGYVPTVEQWRYDNMEDVVRLNRELLR